MSWILFQYDSLRGNATAMKERYEARIQELEEQQSTLEERLHAAQSATQGAVSGDLVEEVCTPVLFPGIQINIFSKELMYTLLKE